MSASPRARHRALAAGGAAWLVALVMVSMPAGATEPVPSWDARLRTTGYLYQENLGDGSQADHFGFFEHYDVGLRSLAGGHLDLRVSGRVSDDLASATNPREDHRLYVGYAGLRWERWRGRARLGRQYLVEGSHQLVFDGLWVSMAPNRRWQIHAWGGAQAPLRRNLEAGDLGDDTAAGIRVLGRIGRRSRFSAWFAQTDRRGVTTARPLGAEIASTPSPALRGLLRVAYDTELEEWTKLQAQAQIQPWADLPLLQVQYVDRQPRVDPGSYFYSHFSEFFERIRLLRGTVRYRNPRGFGAEAEVFGGFVDKREWGRWALAVLLPHGRVGYSYRTGDAGDQDRLYGDLDLDLLPWLRLTGGASYTEYALLEQPTSADERELITAFGRLRAQIRPGARFSIEVQSIDDPFDSKDTRLLLGLDLGASRGPAAFGLGSTGGLR